MQPFPDFYEQISKTWQKIFILYSILTGNHAISKRKLQNIPISTIVLFNIKILVAYRIKHTNIIKIDLIKIN